MGYGLDEMDSGDWSDVVDEHIITIDERCKPRCGKCGKDSRAGTLTKYSGQPWYHHHCRPAPTGGEP